jgi:hypothetical protein
MAFVLVKCYAEREHKIGSHDAVRRPKVRSEICSASPDRVKIELEHANVDIFACSKVNAAAELHPKIGGISIGYP